MNTIRMDEMTWPDIRQAIAGGRTTVVVAVGSSEQHGPHLPTMTDTRIGDALAEQVARKLGDALQARTIPLGCSEHHLAFGGTVSLQPETLKLVLRDTVDSLVRDGFARIVLLPSHGGNFPAVAQAIAEARTRHPGVAVVGYTDLLGFAGFLAKASTEFGVSEEAAGAHAGENETSIMLALEPGLVAVDRFAAGYLGPTGEREVKIILEQGMPALTPNGVLGDPAGASAARGEVYLEKLADFLVGEIGQAPATSQAGRS